jgi:small subunit ribosomal protein S4
MLKGERCTGRKCAVDQRSLPPGRGRPQRRKISDRALQLREKQKARHTYGLMERQFCRETEGETYLWIDGKAVL